MLDQKPLIGTTTALNVLAKPLTWWASGLAVAELGWVNPKEAILSSRIFAASDKLDEIKKLSADEYLALLDKAYKAHSVKLDKSADKGVDMHAGLENYVKNCVKLFKGKPRVEGDEPEVLTPVDIFARWAVKNVKRFIASEGYGYNERLWVGGVFDLLAEDNEGRLFIMDFKSAKDAYMSHFFQCAGNDLQITESGVLDKDGNTIFDLKGRTIDYYGVFPFGMKNPEPQFHFDTAGAKEGFEHCVALHKLLNS